MNIFNIPGIPDFTKFTPMMEEALQTFRNLQGDIKVVKEQQAELLALLKGSQPVQKEGE